MWHRTFILFMAALLMFLAGEAPAQDALSQARGALDRALVAFRDLRIQGGWPMAWSADLTQHWGQDAVIAKDHITVQPPGTPAVGMAYLNAYRMTGSALALAVAREAADILALGQLEVGGWFYEVYLGPAGPVDAYFLKDRGNPAVSDLRNAGVMDDDVTQSAVRFMVAIHQVTGEMRYGVSARAGLAFLLESQYPLGGWPQVYPPRAGHYQTHYTLNDGTMNDCMEALLEGYLTYGDARYLEAVKRGGEWLIQAQLPGDQGGWAQQYDMNMRPAWARWFEPPAVCSAVTARVIGTLIQLYLETGNDRYLTPIPAAIAWLERSQIAEGRWARFYEVGSNRPLYVNTSQQVSYSPINARPGYSWEGSYGVTSRIADYRDLMRLGREIYRRARATLTETQRVSVERNALNRAASLDAMGRWAGDGQIHCGDFVNGVEGLLKFIGLSNTPSTDRRRADFDEDGDVDFGDFVAFAGAFGGTDLRFDLDGDRRVGFSDFLRFARVYGE